MGVRCCGLPRIVKITGIARLMLRYSTNDDRQRSWRERAHLMIAVHPENEGIFKLPLESGAVPEAGDGVGSATRH